MYQREAMWICFHGQHWKPRAVKVGIGKVCAITGKRWTEQLHHHPQDYLVTPPQPWLDGIAAGRGFIRQFVAMPLGMGYTVEGQVTGEERFGGIQIKVFEPRPGLFPDEPDEFPFAGEEVDCCSAPAPCAAPMQKSRRAAGSMGLAAGGRMKQKIYPDPHGVHSWDAGNTARVFVHIVNSELWREITGEEPPATPVTAKSYAAYGLPWFDLYDESMASVPASPVLADVKSIKEKDDETFQHPLQDDEPVDPGRIKRLLLKLAAGVQVRDGDW
jgi:hypothetical protein